MADRREFSAKTRKAALKRSREVVCAQCASAFDRGYAISAKRAARPQLCSQACSDTFKQEQARDRLVHRFWSKVSIGGEDDCWPWTGRKNENGYGVFDYERAPEIASRFAFFLTTGVEVGDKMVCHSCDNPPCCNPGHLWLGTHQDNMKDMALKKRSHITGWKGENHPSSKLKTVDVVAIRGSGLPNSFLAERYAVTAAAIHNIRERKTWRHI